MMFSFHLGRRTICIFDTMQDHRRLPGDDPTSYYLGHIQKIGKVLDLVMEEVNPKWNDDVYDWICSLAPCLMKTRDSNFTLVT
jgi:hypothetical protein